MKKSLIAQAVARGWCSPENENKIMDPDLAWAITEEVVKIIPDPEQAILDRILYIGSDIPEGLPEGSKFVLKGIPQEFINELEGDIDG